MTSTTITQPGPTDLFNRFVVAAWGACRGLTLATILTALLIVFRGDTLDHRHPSILPSDAMQVYVVVPWQEHYEHLWYALVCIGVRCARGWQSAILVSLPG